MRPDNHLLRTINARIDYGRGDWLGRLVLGVLAAMLAWSAAS